MSKKQEFINFVSKMIEHCNFEMSEEVKTYWEAFQITNDNEKSKFTDNGKLILKYLQDNPDLTMLKARDIGEGLFISSRTVSGAMRKLVADGYVEKMGKDPTMYSLTEIGKNINIDEE